MDVDALEQLAELLARRNAIDSEIATLIDRPALPGHIGEWLAAEIFDIELAPSATNKTLDGWFRGAPTPGATVNIKLYGKREGLLDLTEHDPPDFYLVLTGAIRAPTSSRGTHRPTSIDAVYLFDTAAVIDDIRARAAARGKPAKIGTASSVRTALWERAEVYPSDRNPALSLAPDQHAALAKFASAT